MLGPVYSPSSKFIWPVECISTRGTQAWLPICARCRRRATQNRVHWRSPVLFLFCYRPVSGFFTKNAYFQVMNFIPVKVSTLYSRLQRYKIRRNGRNSHIIIKVIRQYGSCQHLHSHHPKTD
jgi:hypothetical protein